MSTVTLPAQSRRLHPRQRLEALCDPGSVRVLPAEPELRDPAATGFVDEIVEPAETRARPAWALATLAGPRS
jgi:acetyl-CoA carboxylase carboxyltransferase component